MKQRIIMIFAVISALAMLVTGCGITQIIQTENAETENDVPEQTEQADTAEVSNSISMGVVDFDTFNPLVTTSQTVKECMQLVYEPLFDMDEKLRPVPVLAESYTVSPDGRTIDITLKSGVTWHDGTIMNAYDAAYTIKQIVSGATQYTESLANMADYRATGDNTLRIVLNYAVPDFVSFLTFPIVKYQSDMELNPNYVPVGTGAFRYGGQMSAGKLYLSANDAYRSGRPVIDTVYIYTVPDGAKYESMFEASEIDIVSSDTVDLSVYTPRGSVKPSTYVTNNLVYLGFNTRSELFSGAETRIGLSELIDKEDIVNSTIYSRGEAVDVPINPSSLFYYDESTKFRADELLGLARLGNDGWGSDEEGYYARTVNGRKQRLAFEILTDADNGELTAAAENIAAAYTEYGIPASVSAVAADEYYEKLGSGAYSAVIGEIEVMPNGDLSPLVSSAGNPFFYVNTGLDTLIGQMGMTHDDEQLMELYRQYGDEILTGMPFAALYFRKGEVLSGAKLKTELSPTISRKYRNPEVWSVK